MRRTLEAVQVEPFAAYAAGKPITRATVLVAPDEQT
jgi:hypothetical protein